MKQILISQHRQKGIAAILILVTLGLALTATMLGSAHYLRTSQEQHMVLHAQTIAEARVWTAAEALRGYLEEVAKDEDEWGRLEEEDSFSFSMEDGKGYFVEAKIIDVSPEQLRAHLTARAAENTRAEAATGLEVVYQITSQGSESPSAPSRSALNFLGGLNISGDLQVRTQPGQNYEMNVDGDVELKGFSAGGIDVVRSTGSISVVGGSSTTVREMHANCDVRLSNIAFTVNNIRATRNVCLADSVSSQSIVANGSVDIKGGTHGDISALANKPGGVAQCASGATQVCELNSTFGVRTNPNPTIGNIYTKGNVEFNSSVTVGDIRAEGDLRVMGCTPNWSSATYGGSFTNNPKCSRSAQASSQPVVLEPVRPVEVAVEVFDANTLREIANYIYSYKDGVARVKIQGVDGVRNSADEENSQEVRDNGYYYRTANILDPGNTGWADRTVAGYACINNNAPSRKDETDGHCLAQLGKANNIGTALPAYVSEWDGWSFNGVSHAPGVVFTEGNARMGGGVYTNTFIATGNLSVTSAGGAVFSLNYAGPNGITAGGYTALGVCNNREYAFRPTEFCKNNYNPGAHSSIGNYALLAGSCPLGRTGGCNKSEYVGGNIDVRKTVFGAVKAGNLFSGAASVSIHGYISALAQRNNGATTNTIGGGATIDLRVPEEVRGRYDPTGGSITPGDGSSGGDGGSGGGEPASAVLRWGRYL